MKKKEKLYHIATKDRSSMLCGVNYECNLLLCSVGTFHDWEAYARTRRSLDFATCKACKDLVDIHLLGSLNI